MDAQVVAQAIRGFGSEADRLSQVDLAGACRNENVAAEANDVISVIYRRGQSLLTARGLGKVKCCLQCISVAEIDG